jgi:hypothetical protein
VTVGGTVQGLANGASLVVADNGGNDDTVTANGTFTFSTPLAVGSAYAVTVVSQPTSPSQTCAVTSGSGTVGAANVTSVVVTCTTDAFPVGGTVSGLTSGTLVLANSGGDPLTLDASGAFAFSSAVASGATYDVTVLQQPSDSGSPCTVSGGSGVIGAAAVTSVVVNCTPGTFTVGGTVTGLAGGESLALEDNGTGSLFVTGNGSFTFAAPLSAGSAYDVTVEGNPSTPVAETCTVSKGSGTVSSNVTDVVVACTEETFPVGGTLSGLMAGNSVVLQDNGGDNLTLTANGAFAFDTSVSSGGGYSVTVQSEPANPPETCTVIGGAGTVSNAAVTSVTVGCSLTMPCGITGTMLGSGCVWTQPGNDSFVPPAGVTQVTLTMIGGGGGGGSGGIGYYPAGGGGSGYYVVSQSVAVTPGTAVPLTVGAGGGTLQPGGGSSFGIVDVNGGQPGQNYTGSTEAEGGNGGSGGGAGYDNGAPFPPPGLGSGVALGSLAGAGGEPSTQEGQPAYSGDGFGAGGAGNTGTSGYGGNCGGTGGSNGSNGVATNGCASGGGGAGGIVIPSFTSPSSTATLTGVGGVVWVSF